MIFYLKGYEHSVEDISEMLKLQSIIRIFAYCVLLGVLFVRLYYGLFSYISGPIIYLTMIMLTIGAAMFLISYKNIYQGWHTFFIKSLPILDLIVISSLVYFSNGIESRFSFLYILPCLSLVVFSIRDLLKVALLSFISYTAVILLDYYNIFGIREVVQYTAEQLSVIVILRMGLIISITVFTSTLLVFYVVRAISRHVDKKEEAVFLTANKLSDPLEETSVLLGQLKVGQELSAEMYSKIVELQSDVRNSLIEKNLIMEKARESAPMCRKINIRTALECGMCNRKIKIFERFWSIPKGYKIAFNYGVYQNEAHCDKCHTKSGDHCDYCEVWK